MLNLKYLTKSKIQSVFSKCHSIDELTKGLKLEGIDLILEINSFRIWVAQWNPREGTIQGTMRLGVLPILRQKKTEVRAQDISFTLEECEGVNLSEQLDSLLENIISNLLKVIN